MTTLNNTQIAAECYVNSIINDKGKKEGLRLIRYNLSGKNPYWGYNVVFDTHIGYYINNVIDPS